MSQAIGLQDHLKSGTDFATVAPSLIALVSYWSRDPENLTRESHKGVRGGRILVDTGRNDYSATFAAAYTVRARRSPVSAPYTWGEVERSEVSPGSFTIRNMAQRVENVGDLWSDLLKTGVTTVADGAVGQAHWLL